MALEAAALKKVSGSLIDALLADSWGFFLAVAGLAVGSVLHPHLGAMAMPTAEYSAALFACIGYFLRWRYLRGRLGSWIAGRLLSRDIDELAALGSIVDGDENWLHLMDELRLLAASPFWDAATKEAELGWVKDELRERMFRRKAHRKVRVEAEPAEDAAELEAEAEASVVTNSDDRPVRAIGR